LELGGSAFEAGVAGFGLHVAGRLYLGATLVQGGTLSLIGAKIDRDLDLTGANLLAGFEADRLNVGSAILADNVTIEGNVSLREVDVGGTLYLRNSVISGQLDANSAHFGRSANFSDSNFPAILQLKNIRVAEHFDLTGSSVSSVDLTQAQIGGALLLTHGSSVYPVQWLGPVLFTLRDAKIGGVVDELWNTDVWPAVMDLQGFSYDHFRSHAEERWVERWLDRDPVFSHQPYQQIASVYRAAGDPDQADTVLYIARDRELADDWNSGNCDYGLGLIQLHRKCWNAVGLGILKVTIGYGIGLWSFLALAWVIAFALLGMAILHWRSAAARNHGWFWCFGASLSQILPIVTLNEEFKKFFDDPDRARIKSGTAVYFAVHAMVGYVLASFVVAALAGLTQAH